MFEGGRVDTAVDLVMVVCLWKQVPECGLSVLFEAVLDIVTFLLLLFFEGINVVLHLGLLAVYVIE